MCCVFRSFLLPDRTGCDLSTVLNRSGENGNPRLAPDLGGSRPLTVLSAVAALSVGSP